VLTPLLAVAPAPDGALRQSALAALADDSFARNDWKDAARWCAELGKGATSNDQIADALLRQGIACVRDGRAADALPLLSRVIDEFGETPQALHATFERGQLRSEAGSLHQARMDFEEVLSHERALPSPRFTVHALRHLASIASKEGRHDEAATILAQVAESPGSGDAGLDARAQQGATLLRAGNYADAERVLEAFTKGNPTHVRTPEAQVRLAIAMSRQGRHEESLAMLGTLDRPRLDADSAALAQYEVAWNQGALKREKEAREAYLVLLAGKAPPPLAGSAALELAQLELNANRPNDALPHLDRAREEASRSSGAEGDGRDIAEREVYLRGVCLLRVNRPRESAEALKTYRDTYPKSAYLAHAMLTRGEALLLAGNHKDACEELAQVATSPVTDSILDATLLRLAEAYAGAHQWEKSDKAYTKHAERFPKSEQWFLARFGQGWARENQSKFADAITIYKDIAERHQGATGARAQFQHGECLYAQKKLDDAVRELLKVDVLFAVPEWSAAGLYEAGRALRELGRTDEALRQFEDVVHRFPDSAWAKQAKDMLDAARPAALPGHQSAKPPAPLPTKPR
jgi:TolA-binding protein